MFESTKVAMQVELEEEDSGKSYVLHLTPTRGPPMDALSNNKDQVSLPLLIIPVIILNLIVDNFSHQQGF